MVPAATTYIVNYLICMGIWFLSPATHIVNYFMCMTYGYCSVNTTNTINYFMCMAYGFNPVTTTYSINSYVLHIFQFCHQQHNVFISCICHMVSVLSPTTYTINYFINMAYDVIPVTNNKH